MKTLESTTQAMRFSRDSINNRYVHLPPDDKTVSALKTNRTKNLTAFYLLRKYYWICNAVLYMGPQA